MKLNLLANADYGRPTDPTEQSLSTVERTASALDDIAAGHWIGATSSSGNQLLGTLPDEDHDALLPHLERVTLEQSATLFDAAGLVSHVYFPESAVIALVYSFRDGRSVEVGTVGREGVAGMPVFLGGAASPVRACVHIAGAAQRMTSEAFARLAGVSGPLHRVMLRYTHAFLMQVTQTAACNGIHLVQERCARSLLMTSERVGSSEFPLTHDFLAFMLGVRRAGVTVAMQGLQDRQLIRYSRGRVGITDRRGLERMSCECYGALRTQYVHLLQSDEA